MQFCFTWVTATDHLYRVMDCFLFLPADLISLKFLRCCGLHNQYGISGTVMSMTVTILTMYVISIFEDILINTRQPYFEVNKLQTKLSNELS